MDNRVAMMLEKAKVVAGKTSQAATRAVDQRAKRRAIWLRRPNSICRSLT